MRSLAGHVVLCIFSFGPFLGDGNAQELTLPGAIARFERENQRGRAIQAQVRVRSAETRSWSLAPNPSATYTREDAAGAQDGFFLVQQSLPLSGRLRWMKRAGSSESSAAEAQAEFKLLSLRRDLRSAFYDLLAAQEREALLEQATEQVREVVRILRARETEGEGSKFDRLRAERELADIQASHASARVLLTRGQALLASFFATGTSPVSLRVQGTFAPAQELPALESLLDRARASRGDLLAGQRRLDRFAAERRAASRLRIPEPILSAGLKRSTIPGRAENGYAVSVTVPIPLFNRGQVESEVARYAEEQTAAEVAASGQEIETEVRAAYETVRLKRRIAEQYARDLGRKSEELAGIAQVAYREGQQGILELLDAYRVGLFARLQSLELSASARMAEIELNRAVGAEVLP